MVSMPIVKFHVNQHAAVTTLYTAIGVDDSKLIIHAPRRHQHVYDQCKSSKPGAETYAIRAETYAKQASCLCTSSIEKAASDLFY